MTIGKISLLTVILALLCFLKDCIFSTKTISVDFHKFENSEIKLLILGLTGSGKTTIGKKLAKKMNVERRSTDECPFDWKIYNGANKIVRDKMLNKYLDCCESMIQDNKKGILEGIGVIEVYLKRPNVKKNMLELPCIILGTSVLKSGIRASKRTGGSLFDLHFYKTNLKYGQKILNKFRKERTNIKGSVVRELKEWRT